LCQKADPFVCFIRRDGKEAWFDDVGYGLEKLPQRWAEKNLTDIKDVK